MQASEAPLGKQKHKSKSNADESPRKRPRNDLPPASPMPPPTRTAPAWLAHEGVSGAVIQDTGICARDVGQDQDLILLRVSLFQMGDLHGRRIHLPLAPEDLGELDELDVSMVPSSSLHNTYLLGSEAGAVSAAPVAAVFQAHAVLEEVDAEEGDIDMALLALPEEAAQDVPETTGTKKKKKPKEKKNKAKHKDA